MMNLDFTEEQQLLEQSVREWAARSVAPLIRELDRAHQFDRGILPQMAVKVAFRETGAATNANAASASRAVLVPRNAVRNQDGRDVVFVVRDRRAERRAVTVASAQNDETVLSAGVSVGERVVVDAPVGLTDGAAVEEKKP